MNPYNKINQNIVQSYGVNSSSDALNQANIKLGAELQNICEENINHFSKLSDDKSRVLLNRIEPNSTKLSMQIDTDIRESLPPQMMAVVSSVLNLIQEIGE